MLDTMACRRQEQQCLSLAASSQTDRIRNHFIDMAGIWNKASKEGDTAVLLQDILEKVLGKQSKPYNK